VGTYAFQSLPFKPKRKNPDKHAPEPQFQMSVTSKWLKIDDKVLEKYVVSFGGSLSPLSRRSSGTASRPGSLVIDGEQFDLRSVKGDEDGEDDTTVNQDSQMAGSQRSRAGSQLSMSQSGAESESPRDLLAGPDKSALDSIRWEKICVREADHCFLQRKRPSRGAE
jgi:hypothetical protein